MRWLCLLIAVCVPGWLRADEATELNEARDRLRQVVAYVQTETNLFPVAKVTGPRMLTRAQKETAWQTWQSLLDAVLALDRIGREHRNFYLRAGAERSESFVLTHAAFLASYRGAIEFLARTGNDAGFDRLLNEPVPELGLPRDTYAAVKYRFLHVARGAEFAAGEAASKMLAGQALPQLRGGIAEDRQAIWKMGKGSGELLTVKNGLTMLRRAGYTAWFPVQTGVAEWMGDTRMVRREHGLISRGQITNLIARLEPGDIILERRNWYVSNIGLPGFWPHAALYVGTAAERRQFFGKDDPALTQPEKAADGHATRILEAVSEGVVFNSVEHSLDADCVAVLRPRLGKTERAVALRRAFHYSGRPYDFDFDFLTDAKLVCSELVYKAYEPAPSFAGVKLPLTEMLGRHLLPPNLLVREWAAGKVAADFVAFLDAREHDRRAIEATADDLRRSWSRPKWHVPVQKLGLER